MSEDADIEILLPKADAAKPRTRFGFAVLLGVAFLASAFGSGAAFLASEMVKKPLPDIAPLASSLETLTTENKTLKAQIARLQRDIKALPKSQSVDLSGLESRLNALEIAEPQSIDPDLVTRLEALKAEGSQALDLSDILARLETLENRPVMAAPVMTETISDVVTIEFPLDAILAVLNKSEASGSWLKKSLKKHISVQSDDNPHYLVEVIVESLEAGDMEAAAKAFDKLPPEAKAAGKAWRESLESN